MSLEEQFNKLSSKEPSPEDVRAFIDATRNNDKATVENYLSKFPGRIVNAKDRDGHYALLMATIQGHTGIVSLLLEKGAALDMVNNAGHSALIGATIKGDKDLVALLLQKGAGLDAKNNFNGYTALMWAKSCGHGDIAMQIQAVSEQRQLAKQEAEDAQREEIRRRELREAAASVHEGLKEDMDAAPPLRFIKKGPSAP